MTQDRMSVDRSLLIEQGPWITRLAKNLVRDPAGAEDVVQETLLAALAAPPRDAADARRLRAWLGRVAFNLAHLKVRRNMRRRAREEHAARSESQGSTADSVMRSSIMRHVVDAVKELPEPYRTAVELRYFEGLSTGEIARRTETSESAVRKRLWRARGQLRRTLDSSHNGERMAWFQGLAPLAGIDPRSLVPSAGQAALGGKLAAGALALVAGAVLTTVALLAGAPGEDPFSGAAGAHAARATDGSGASVVPSARRSVLNDGHAPGSPDSGATAPASSTPEAPAVERVPADAEAKAEAGPEEASPTEPPTEVHGVAIDLWGRPLGGLSIVAEARPADVLGETGAAGSFRVEVASLPVTLRAQAARFASVRTATVLDGEEAWPTTLVAAPAVSVAGRVVDETGRALAARLEVVFDEEAFVALPVAADVRGLRAHAASNASDGTFSLPCVPSGTGIYLRASAVGYVDEVRRVPEFDVADAFIALRRASPVARAWRGVVLDSGLRPVPDARVVRGRTHARTDADGRFELEGPELDAAADGPLIAYKDGFAPKRVHVDFGADVTVVLDGVQERIQGHIRKVRATKSLRDWVVFVTLDEDHLADVAPDEEAGSSDGAALGGPGVLEDRRVADPRQIGVPVDEHGAFEFWGAEGHAYRVIGFHPDTHEATRAERVQAGATDSRGVELVPLAGGESLEFVVLDPSGAPLEGAEVSASLTVASDGQTWSVELARARSSGGGALLLDGAPWDEAALAELASFEVNHPRFAQRGAGRTGREAVDAEGATLGLTIEPESAFRLESFRSADGFRVLDADGAVIQMRGPLAPLAMGRLFDGRSAVMSVPSSAETLVWMESGREVGRQRLELVPGDVSVVTAPEPALVSAELTAGTAENGLRR